MKQNWADQKILIIGAARQGLSLARYLAARGAQVTLNDQRPMEKMRSEVEALSNLPIKWVLGSHPLDLLEGVQRVCISGGVPLTLPIIQAAQSSRPTADQ